MSDDNLQLKEYIITAQDYKDLESIYADLENASDVSNIPNRPVECALRRTISRNTHYYLTAEEAESLKNDPRILSVDLTPEEKGLKVVSHSTQYSDKWNKSGDLTSTMKNWGLLRSTLGSQIEDWGSNGDKDASGTITLNQTGKNVDVIISDADGFVPNHPEFAKNADGTGGSRCVYYDWYQHNVELGFAPVAPYVNNDDGDGGYHAVHTAGTTAGNTQGWARDANIYNIAFTTTNPLRHFDYIRAFHQNKPINEATGRKNPTIVNMSWGYSYILQNNTAPVAAINYQGELLVKPLLETPLYRGFNGVQKVNQTFEENGDLVAEFLTPENSSQTLRTAGEPYLSTFIVDASEEWTTVLNKSSIDTDPVTASYQFTIQGPCWVYHKDLILKLTYTQDEPGTPESLSATITGTLNDGTSDVIVVTDTLTFVSDTEGNDLTDSAFWFNFGEFYANNFFGDAIRATENAVYTYTIDITIDDQTINGAYGQLLGNLYFQPVDNTAADNTFIPGSGWTHVENRPQVGTASLTSTDTSLTNINFLTKVPNFYDDFFGEADNPWGNLNQYTVAVDLPFAINFFGDTITEINVNAHGIISFGGPCIDYTFNDIRGSFESIDISPLPKIVFQATFVDGLIAAEMYTSGLGGDGNPGSRTYSIRLNFNTVGNPEFDILAEVEFMFFEDDPSRIDIIYGNNLNYYARMPYTGLELALAGIALVPSQGYPALYSAVEEDVKDAINEGVIFVGSAGNSCALIDTVTGLNYNNYFVQDESIYPFLTLEDLLPSIPMCQGSSPNAPYAGVSKIIVGAVADTATEEKASYSNKGPAITVLAPGTNIISSWNDDNVTDFVNDPRNSSYHIAKISGTSMASPQVCGILACALETYPTMTQQEAYNYIRSYAKLNQLTDLNDGLPSLYDPPETVYFSSLFGAENRYAYYPLERNVQGEIFPKKNYKFRPATGLVFPRNNRVYYR